MFLGPEEDKASCKSVKGKYSYHTVAEGGGVAS